MRILRIGHRGASGHAPENTLASIEKAIVLGVDFVEVDVRCTRDGHLVLLHDAHVTRTTNGRGLVSRMTLEEVRKLDAGGGLRIPTLQEVFEVADGQVGLVLEIKAAGIAASVAVAVRHSGFRNPVIYASFLHSELQKMHAALPSAATMALFGTGSLPPVAYFADLKVSHVGLPLRSATRQSVETLHAAGLRVFVFTVNDPSEIQQVKSLGVEGIISDFPERI